MYMFKNVIACKLQYTLFVGREEEQLHRILVHLGFILGSGKQAAQNAVLGFTQITHQL